MADKHTKRELFENLLIFASAAEADTWVIDGLNHELELLDKRASKGSKNPKHEAEVAANKAAIEAALTDAEPMRATAIASECGMSVQRVTALVRQMVADGSVVREQDGKVVTFRLV
jgi:predicted Rossmann fold nucleotide-binding protein DprA/Smf involved in DNA uptake